MIIMVLNCGSSSVKYQLFNIEKEDVLAKGIVERIGLDGSRLKHITEKKDVFIEREINDHDEAIELILRVLTDEDYGVIVAGNMFGDIASDGFAGLIGGLGFAASSQMNPESGVAVFEPTHGSAPKYADYDTSIVNPIAMIESACMMLDFVGENDKAKKVRNAVAKVIEEGKVRTYDMMKMRGRADVIENGAASTNEMADAVIANLS